MELSDIVIIILLIIAIYVWYQNLNKKCPVTVTPPAQIIYRFKPDLDLQFDTTNFPTAVYDQMFSGANTYQGGYKLDSNNTGKVNVSVNNQNNKGGTINPVPINSTHS